MIITVINFRTTKSKACNTGNRSVKNKNRLYEKSIGISKKKKDLLTLCKEGYILKIILVFVKISNATIKMRKKMFLPFEYFIVILSC